MEASEASAGAGRRVVVGRYPGDDEDVLRVFGTHSGGTKAAKEAAIEEDEDLRNHCREGGVQLAAVPAANLKLKEVMPPTGAFRGLS